MGKGTLFEASRERREAVTTSSESDKGCLVAITRGIKESRCKE